MDKKQHSKSTLEWSEPAYSLRVSGWSEKEIAEEFGKSMCSVRIYANADNLPYMLKDRHPSFLAKYGIKTTKKKIGVKEAREAIEKNPDIGVALMGVDRKFPPVREASNGAVKNGVIIRCHHADDADFQKIGCQRSLTYWSNGKTIHPLGVLQYFRNKGWVIGGGPNADTCPKCNEYHIQLRRAKKTVSAIQAEVTEATKAVFEAKQEGAVQEVLPVVKLVKELDKTTKRLISDKLDEVYDDKKGGYQNDWDDQKIATDLGTSKLYVALVREEFHGPNVSASDTNKEVEALKTLAVEVLQGQKRIENLMKHFEELDEKLNGAIAENQKRTEAFATQYKALSNRFQ